MKNIKVLLVLVFLFGINTSRGQEVEDAFSWPKEIVTNNKSVITLYQPQLESFEGNVLEGRMAVTVKLAEKETIFGAVWFKSTLSTNKDERTALLEKMHIIKTHFPDIVDQDNADAFGQILSDEMESWNLEMSLDRLTASMNEVENRKKLSDNIKNDPPKIYLRTTPAVLLMIDGEPIFKKDEESGLEYVVNTSFFIVKESGKKDYYIKGGKFWYTSKNVKSDWKATKKAPKKIEKFAKENLEDSETDEDKEESFKEAPELIIATSAAELIQINGEIDYKAIDGTNLLYVSNSEIDILMDITSQNHYVLLAGRWYKSKSLEDGEWVFEEPGNLPEEFKQIPENSEMETVRASIPGTPEAANALLEQSIPQTATIDRKTATVEVKYDGDPEFENIEGTDMSYAKNTDKSVLLIDGKYYAVDDAVWFYSDRATGPWTVSDKRPSEIDEIPADSPVYNVKYTYVYDSTPEVVYVGYLPGYTHSYIYNGVVVYGTGYYYNPWYGHYYYPRHVTWGYGVHWSPYGGWGFHFGLSYGWIGWGFHPYRGLFWGPRGYRRGYRRGYHRGARNGYRRGYSSGKRNSSRNRNVYSNRKSGVKNSSNNRAKASNSMNNKTRSNSGKANNMYSDRKGNVYQRNNSGGFDNKTNKQKPSSTQNRTNNSTNRSRTTNRSTQQNLNRSYQNRSSGSSNYNRSRSSGGMSRGGGGRRR